MDNVWQLFAEGIPDILVQLSVEGTILHINRTPPGRTPSDVLGKNVFEFLVPASRTTVRRALDEVFGGAGSRVHEIPMLGDDGKICWYEARVSPMVIGGRIVAAAVIARDITSQKHAGQQLERQLQQFQKLDTLGHMAGGIAHDFNNILTVITSSAEMLLLDLDPGSEHHTDVQVIREASRRGAQLTRQILSFARAHELNREPLDLNSVVQHTVAMLRRLMGANVALVEQLDPSTVTILGDRGQVEQILVNLLLNARDAVGVAGTVTVSTQCLPDQSIAMRVADDGTGISEGIQPKIFEAFFTTKPPGQGTGLGLATVSALVGSHGGTIAVTSRVGEGTTFEIVFPATGITEPLEMP